MTIEKHMDYQFLLGMIVMSAMILGEKIHSASKTLGWICFSVGVLAMFLAALNTVIAKRKDDNGD